MKQFLSWLAAALSCLALVSCASYTRQGTDAAIAGRYAEAESLLLQGIREDDEAGQAWTNLGVLYERTGRKDQSIAAVIMGARYGNKNAQTILTRQGRIVPKADLEAKTMSDAQLLLLMSTSFAKGWNEGTPIPASPAMPVTCNSMRSRGGDYTTTCQ